MPKVDTSTLYRLYVEEKRSIRSIALLLQVAPRTVYDAMIHARIPRRQRGRVHSDLAARPTFKGQLDEATLRQLYLVEKHSIREIAKIVDSGATTIHHALVVWNIPRRKPGQTHHSTYVAVDQAEAVGALAT